MLKRTQKIALAGIASVLAFGSLTAQTATSLKQPSQANTAEDNSDQQAEMQKLSEAFGHFIGRNLNNPGMKFDLEAIIKGMREGAAGKAAPMSDQEYESLLIKAQERAFKEISEKNLKAANAFLEENKGKAGVVELEPGKLQYLILEQGTGAAVEPHNAPMIHYTGKYLDGTVFGSSKDNGSPITIPLDQTIPGFSKGILGMKEGEKRRLFVHPDLGYGTMGQLPPNSMLIFDIELVKANNPDQKSASLDNDDELQSLAEMEMPDDDSDDEDDSSDE